MLSILHTVGDGSTLIAILLVLLVSTPLLPILLIVVLTLTGKSSWLGSGRTFDPDADTTIKDQRAQHEETEAYWAEQQAKRDRDWEDREA